MTIYFLILGLIIGLGLLAKVIKNGRRIYLGITMVILLFVSSFRAYYIGADYIRYVPIFRSIQYAGLEHYYEKGYVILNLIAGKISDDYWALGLCVNCLIFLSLYFYWNRNISERYYALILLIFYLNPYLYIQNTFNMLRQGCATAIILLAIEALYEKKWIKYILIIILAAQFHKVAYVFLLLAPVRMIKWEKMYFYILLIISSGINLISSNLIFMKKFFALFSFEGYADTEITMFDFKIYTLFIAVVSYFLIVNYDYLWNRDEKKRFYIDIYLLALCLLPIFVKNDQLYRVYVIFEFITLPAISYIVEGFYRKGNAANYNIVKWGYIAYYFALWFAFFITQQNNRAYVPFVFFWNS